MGGRAGMLCCAGVGLVCGGAVAQPLELAVDPARSTMSMTIELQTVAGNRTDTDSASIQGYVLAGSDDPASPGTVVVYDFRFELDDDLAFNWSFGFAGSAQATVSGAALFDAAPGVAQGPVPVSGGDFTVLDVPTATEGVADSSYNILLVGSGDTSVDLSTLEAQAASLAGSLSSSGGMVEFTTTVPFGGEFEVVEGVATAVITGTATIVATATIPACPADIAAPFGSLDFFDVSAFLTGYNNHAPLADFSVDGAWNFFDVSAFLTAFNRGCD